MGLADAQCAHVHVAPAGAAPKIVVAYTTWVVPVAVAHSSMPTQTVEPLPVYPSLHDCTCNRNYDTCSCNLAHRLDETESNEFVLGQRRRGGGGLNGGIFPL